MRPVARGVCQNGHREGKRQMLTLEQARAAIDSAETLYLKSGQPITLTEADIDANEVEYGAYVLADPDDMEPVRHTVDLFDVFRRDAIMMRLMVSFRVAGDVQRTQWTEVLIIAGYTTPESVTRILSASRGVPVSDIEVLSTTEL